MPSVSVLARAGAIAALAISLSACGGARSTQGTSASNCVASLEAALTQAPQHAQFRGLAEVPGRAGPRFGVRRSRRPYCVVLFELPGRRLVLREVFRLGGMRPILTRTLPARRLRPADIA
jgi:hypothetical protein